MQWGERRASFAHKASWRASEIQETLIVIAMNVTANTKQRVMRGQGYAYHRRERPDGAYVEIWREIPGHSVVFGAASSTWNSRVQTGGTGIRFPRRLSGRPTEIAHAAKALLAWRAREPQYTRAVEFSDFRHGNKPLALIAGPCVIDSEDHVHFVARAIREAIGMAPTVFKR